MARSASRETLSVEFWAQGLGPGRFHAFKQFVGLAGDEEESEDCLNLNVFAPEKAKNLPVFVWIYGGSSVEGHVGWDFYGPLDNIVRRHPCIVVAMNYRLGVLGYLALKELSAVDPRKGSGNAGITDQQLAMRWVQENIHAFGGDPNRVTLIGQSSGGTSIWVQVSILGHLASRSSRGLFHGAISLSASPNITMDRAAKEAQDRALLLPHTPCAGMSESTLLECLYTADFGPFLHKNFDKAYGAEAVEKIRMFYDKYEPAQYGVFALDSDTGLACALRRFAMAAREGFRSPVYWSTVTSMPNSTVALMWDLPFHNWDFMAAVKNWDTFGYTPKESDVAFGERILGDWYQFLTQGNITDRGYAPVQATKASENVVGNDVGETKTSVRPNHKHDVCEFWESIGVDQRWWWIN
ncbi:ACHE [Symbiodinium sp. CCMP2456]|nr:ACHE [Symbiodinium sp. CCMP2456]